MPDEGLVSEIDAQLAFQTKWKRIMSVAYFSCAALAITASAGATVVAALEYSVIASILAGTATTLFGLEKALLFREKWSHHLSSAMQLQALKIEYLHGGLDNGKASQRMADILMSYAVHLPIAPREDTT